MNRFLDISGMLGLPEQASAHAGHIDYMMGLVHILMAILFVGWGAFFIYCLVRFRSSRNPVAQYKLIKGRMSTVQESGVVVAEIILLFGFAIPTWATIKHDFPAAESATVVHLVAEQFAWNVHYPGPDGVFGRTEVNLVDDTIGNNIGLDRNDPAARDDVFSINNLVLPVDRDIVIRLTSRDVIHSFFLPQMRVKQDAIPGMSIPIHFRAVQTTPEDSRYPGCFAEKNCWEIACAQLCGITHFQMRGFYQVLPQAEFDAWMAQQQAALGNDNP